MKIIKNNHHSLFIKPFGIRGKIHLACSIMILFDLINPDELLSEQELWQKIPPLLGEGGIIDMGMPKPRAEVLVTGKCFTPGGEPRPASQVSFTVGSINKTLNVFGNRYWKLTPGGRFISEPEPFTEMPITWDRGFGGRDFKKNPLGKGMDKVTMPDGKEVLPLPNIEDPQNMIGSPSDRPEPQSFGPIDLMWPQRFKKRGTYDDRWLKERWPYFPDDMDYEFFNMAPEDQFLDEFFTGNEAIEITNMHPDMPVIKSRLPGIRARCFVTKKKSVDAPPDEDSFVEVNTLIDTLWLFPEILRGLLIFRGTTEIQDEEFGDVRYIFLVNESMEQEPESISHYLEEQKKRIDRGLVIDPAPLEAAKNKIAKALKRIKSLPKEIEEKKLRAMGKAPRMDYSPDEMAEKTEQLVKNGKSLISRMERQAQEMHTKWGHMVEIPLNIFDPMKEKLDGTEAKIKKALSKAKELKAQALKRSDEIKQQVKENLKNLPPDKLKEAGIDPDNPFPEKEKKDPWHERGFPLVIKWRKALEKDTESINKLNRMGFEKRTIKRAWLGINHEEIKESPQDWGLEQKDDKEIFIPEGLVMPRFHEATLTGFRIRQDKWSGPDKDFLMKGSRITPLFLPAVEPDGAPVIRVSDELEAWLMEQEVGDACSVIALKDAEESPDKDSKKAIESALSFLVVVPGDLPDNEWTKWEDTYPNSKRLTLPEGNSLFDLVKNDIDIRKWVMDELPQEFSQKHNVDISLPEPGKAPDGSPLEGVALPIPDIKGMVNKLMDEIKAFHKPRIDELNAKKAEMEKQVEATKKELAEKLRSLGKDPDEILKPQETPTRKPYSEVGKDIAKRINQEKERLKSLGQLTPENEAKMDESAKKAISMGDDAEKRYQEAQGRLKDAKSKIETAKAGGIPDDMKDKFKAHGVDPERIKKLTREEVIERYQMNRDLSGAILSGLDLSGLDLEGINLEEAQCRKTRFCNCNLKGAIFKQTLAQEADFTGATLDGARVEKGIFIRAKFKQASLNSMEINQGVFREADLEEADLSSSDIKMSIFQKAKLKNVKFFSVKAEMSVFSGADATDADFKEGRFFKCLFQGTILHNADFSSATIQNTMFFKAKGQDVKFTGADMSKARMGGNAQFPGADMTNIRMNQGCFRESDLSNSSFRGSKIERSMFEGCNLKNTDFYLVPAKNTRFSKCDLEGANMRGVNLFQGSLRKSRLVNTDLRDSNLFAVDFYKVKMGKTRIEGANLNRSLLKGRVQFLTNGEIE